MDTREWHHYDFDLYYCEFPVNILLCICGIPKNGRNILASHGMMAIQ